MTGIGNDIVALKTIDSLRTQSPRFYTKILAPAEQHLYHEQFTALPFEHFVWLLWSVKESAYKCLQRHQPELVFSPTKIILTQFTPPSVKLTQPAGITEATGFNDAECFCSKILFQSQTLYARSFIYGDEWISSVVQVSPNFDYVCWGIKHIDVQPPEEESTITKDFLLERLRAVYPGQTLIIRKDDSGCPHLLANNIPTNRPISLSHYGGYATYAFV